MFGLENVGIRDVGLGSLTEIGRELAFLPSTRPVAVRCGMGGALFSLTVRVGARVDCPGC